MTELLYDPLSVACFMLRCDMGPRTGVAFLERVYREDAEYLPEKYRGRKRAFIADALYWTDYFSDKAAIDGEFQAVARELAQRGRALPEDRLVSDYPELDLFFMVVRLRLKFLKPRGYERMKLRTLLREYGYQRRSEKLLRHVRECMRFYRLQPFLRGGEPCDIGEIALDDMITFRLNNTGDGSLC